MSEEEKPRIALEDVAPVVMELAAERELPALTTRFLELVRAWAAPSAVVAAVRDGQSESGWRLIPALVQGSVPVGVEKSLAALVQQAPECLARPTLLRPKDEVPGVKPRDNCVVPWWSEGESGLLLLRGVPRPYPKNLGDALALASAPLWPRLLGSPAGRVESLLDELRGMTLRLEREASRQLERLQAADAVEAPRPEHADDAGRVAALEEELRSARGVAECASAAQQLLNDRLADLERALDGTRTERDEAHAELERLSARCAVLESERDEERAQARRVSPGLEALTNERDSARAEMQGLSARVAALESERGAAEEKLVTAQRELAAMRAFGEPRDLLERLARIETALDTTRTERDRARAEADRAAAHLEPLQAEQNAVRSRLEELRGAVEAAEARARTAEDALASVQGRIDEARALAASSEARSREATERWEGATSALQVALTAVRRAAFVPPGLRLSMEDVSSLVEAAHERPAPWLRIAVLDRDPAGLEPLSDELEAAGLEVRVANHPEELGLLLRTPAARDLAAVVCDVMAFRPDQNVAGLFRSWDKDRPGLAYCLSYNPDNQGELDRARRVPQSLTLAHFPRPLAKPRLLESFEALARRRAPG